MIFPFCPEMETCMSALLHCFSHQLLGMSTYLIADYWWWMLINTHTHICSVEYDTLLDIELPSSIAIVDIILQRVVLSESSTSLWSSLTFSFLCFGCKCLTVHWRGDMFICHIASNFFCSFELVCSMFRIRSLVRSVCSYCRIRSLVRSVCLWVYFPFRGRGLDPCLSWFHRSIGCIAESICGLCRRMHISV